MARPGMLNSTRLLARILANSQRVPTERMGRIINTACCFHVFNQRHLHRTSGDTAPFRELLDENGQRVNSKSPVWIFRDTGDKTFAQLSRKKLMAELSVSTRVVRMIDGSVVNRHPVVAAHGSSVVVSLDRNVRIVIKRDRLIMLDPCTPIGVRLHAALSKALMNRSSPDSVQLFGPDTSSSQGLSADEHIYVRGLERDEVPFVMKALDGVLKFVASEMDNQLHTLTNAVSSILIMLGRNPTDEVLQKLIPLKSSLSAFSVQLEEFKEAVDDIADDEKQLRRFDLDAALTSRPKSTQDLPRLDHVDANADLLGEIFDHYFYIADEISNEVDQLLKDIKGHEEVLSITLDSQRNKLIHLNLFVSSGALVVGVSAMAASLFGMNTHVEDYTACLQIPQHLEFPFVTSTIMCMTVINGAGFHKLYKNVIRGRKQAVHAQVVLDTLFWQADRIDAGLVKCFGAHTTLNLDQFKILLSESDIDLQDEEIKSLFDLFVGADGKLHTNFFMSILHQRKQAVRAHPKELYDGDNGLSMLRRH